MKVERLRAVVDRTALFDEIVKCTDLRVEVRDAAAAFLRLLPTEITPVFHRDGPDAELLFDIEDGHMATVSVHDEGPDSGVSISVYSHALQADVAAQIIVRMHGSSGS